MGICHLKFKEILSSQEGISSMELVNWSVNKLVSCWICQLN